MKERLTRNIGVKILSIILAVILWLVITNIDNPVERRTFTNVEVQLLNKEELATLGKVYDITGGEKIDFTVAAKRNIIDKLKLSDMVVTADFKHMTKDFHTIIIDITCPKYGDEVAVVDGKYQVMSLVVDKLVEKNFKVNIMEKGNVSKGYSIGQKTANPNIITVKGPKNKIEQIAELVVEPNVAGANGSFHLVEEPKAMDKDGKELDASDFTFSEKYVEADFELYKTKTINLQITVTGKPADGYVTTKIEYAPKQITIAAADDDLKRMTYQWSVAESISGISKSVERTIDIQKKLPEGIQLAQDDANAVVNITVEKLQTKEVQILPQDIKLEKKPDYLDLSFNTKGSVKVKVRGPESEIKNIEDTLKPSLDLSQYTRGTYVLPIDFELPPHTVITNTPVVKFSLAQ
jgi:YbbR domain-containing protein